MNDKIASMVIFFTLMLIMINAFIAVSGQLKLENGTSVSSYIGADNNSLGSDWNRANAYQYGAGGTSTGTTPSGTDTVNVCNLAYAIPLIGGLAGDTCNAAADAYRFSNLLVFGVETYMDVYAKAFPEFALIFYGFKYIALALKIAFVIYVAIIARQLLGRSQ